MAYTAEKSADIKPLWESKYNIIFAAVSAGS
jgi:hypothetical protein